MNRAIFSACAALLLISGCGNSSEPEVTQASADVTKMDTASMKTSEVQSPVQIEYTVIGTPIVGQAVALDLRFKSTLGAQPYKVSFRVNDPTAMQLPEAQSASVSISPSSGEERVAQQVTVIPLREGRLYLNVAAVIETESGSMQTVIAIPIQVGPAAPRRILENGTVTTDASGERLRSLPAKED